MISNKDVQVYLDAVKAKIDYLSQDEDPELSLLEWANQAVPPGFVLDDWQKELLRDHHRSELLLCSRQVGKSEAVAIKSSAYAATHANSIILMIAPSTRQSLNLFDKSKAYLRRSPTAQLLRDTRNVAELDNGSQIIALPGDDPDKVRGYTADGVIVDEASFVKNSVFKVVFPMLGVSNGFITMLTTPSGPSGVFYNAWQSEDGWHRVKVFATSCPRYTKQSIEEAKKKLGDVAFRQEYGLEFLSSGNAFFSPELIEKLFDES